MVVDSGSSVSAISPETAAEPASVNLLGQPGDPPYQYRLTRVTLGRQALPDIQVRVLPRLTPLRVVGLAGLDFLRQFAAIRFCVAAMRLVLEDQ